MKKAFTLIELLVVVLIIGILSAIALPQYERAVERSRLAEGLITIRAMENKLDEYLLANGLGPLGGYRVVEVEETDNHNLKYFEGEGPNGVCDTNGCYIVIHRNGNKYQLSSEKFSSNPSVWVRKCWTYSTDIGQKICHSLEADGWEYQDSSY